MFGPAGFMQAPNTHAMRREENSSQPEARISLGDAWKNKSSKVVSTVIVEPTLESPNVVLRSSNGKRRTSVPLLKFFNHYEQVPSL